MSNVGAALDWRRSDLRLKHLERAKGSRFAQAVPLVYFTGVV